MSEKKNIPTVDTDWFEIQKKYLDALMAFTPSNPFATTSKPSPESFWVNAMDQWWQSVKPATPKESETLFEKIIEQCRNYYLVSEQFSNLIEGMSNLKQKDKDIIAFINKKFEEIEPIISASQNIFNWSNFVDACEQPLEIMKKMMAGMPFNMSDAFAGIKPEARKIMDQYLSMPGVGYSREFQEKVQEATRLWAIYQDNYQEYQIAISKLNHDALELMRKKILHMTKKGEEINSMRQIYDLWVESSEKVYADYVLTREYSELNGRLVNSLMAFKKQSHEITEELLSAMNMPTSKAMNTLERRQYELRKQVRVLENNIKELKNEIKDKTTDKTKASVIKKKKKTKPASRKKEIKRHDEQSKVVEFKPKKKKATKDTKSTKKKVARKKADNKSVGNGMIEIKF